MAENYKNRSSDPDSEVQRSNRKIFTAGEFMHLKYFQGTKELYKNCKTDAKQLFSYRFETYKPGKMPLVLLPPVRPRIQSENGRLLLKNVKFEVIPCDTITSFILFSEICTSVTVDNSNVSDLPKGQNNFNYRTGYLDNFADFCRTKVRFKTKFKKGFDYDIKELMKDISCPSCLKILGSVKSIEEYLRFQDIFKVSRHNCNKYSVTFIL